MAEGIYDLGGITEGQGSANALTGFNMQDFSQGIKDFSSGVFKGTSQVSADKKTVVNTPSTLNQIMPAAEFLVGVKQFKAQEDFNEQARKDALLANRQNILGNIDNVNRSMGSKEFNRAKLQGFSDEDARAKADAFVAERGLKAEQFGVKDFNNSDQANQANQAANQANQKTGFGNNKFQAL